MHMIKVSSAIFRIIAKTFLFSLKVDPSLRVISKVLKGWRARMILDYSTGKCIPLCKN